MLVLSQVTGGADGGISLWPLRTYNTDANLLTFNGDLFGEDCTSTEGQNQNFPRRTGLTSKGNIVAVTDSGCLLYCTVLDGGQGNWRLVHQDKKLASYCLLEMSPCRQSVALASMDGYILVFKGKYEYYQLVFVLPVVHLPDNSDRRIIRIV
jgi:hypothetical protein